MNISLASFEEEIDEVILERGWRYYKKGHITDFTELSTGEYNVTVEGTEEYKVSFRIQKNQVIDPVCTCPYDGPVCKHVAAVIFYYVKEIAEGGTSDDEELPKSKAPKKKSDKKKTLEQQVAEVLQQLSAVELKTFITEHCKRNDAFARTFLAQYAFLSQESSKELYVKQLHSQLRSIQGRQGFIDYYQSGLVHSIGMEFLRTATSHFQQQRYRIAWDMACALLEVFTEALGFTDDSNGDVGGCINDASELMQQVVNEKPPGDLRKECFLYTTNAYRKKLFHGWDWHELQMDLAIGLVNTKDEAAELHSLLDTVKPSGQSWDWEMQQAEVQRYHLINKTEGAAKANGYLQQNLHNSELRKQAIEQFISSGSYNEAIHLAEQGVKNDEENLPGLANEWREYLLKIFRLKKDTENIIKYAFYLFVYSNQVNEELYNLLKEHTPEEKWEGMVRHIIKAIKQHNRFGTEYRLAQIYKREQYWDELFDLIQQSPSFSFLDEFEKHLPGEYAARINRIYLHVVYKVLSENTGRKYYETACRYLRKLKKRGAKELVNEAINEFRKQYSQRRALIEELNLV